MKLYQATTLVSTFFMADPEDAAVEAAEAIASEIASHPGKWVLYEPVTEANVREASTVPWNTDDGLTVGEILAVKP